jgi:hypothetical protein
LPLLNVQVIANDLVHNIILIRRLGIDPTDCDRMLQKPSSGGQYIRWTCAVLGSTPRLKRFA